MEISAQKSFDFTRIFELLQFQKDRYPNHKALSTWTQGSWRSYSITTIMDKADALSLLLLQAGFKKADRAILVPESGSPDWIIIDMALQQIGIVVVPVHPTLQADEINYIFNEIEPNLIVTLNKSIYNNWLPLTTTNIFHLEPGVEGYFHFMNDTGLEYTQITHLQTIKDMVHEEDLSTILYTSGSTGINKGVMLSHKNIIHTIKAILTILPLDPGTKVISFLPFSHIFERTTCYAYLAFGVSIYFSEDKSRFSHDFRSVRPVFCTAVPRVLEKMYDHLDGIKLRKNNFVKSIIDWAITIGEKYDVNKTLDLKYKIQLTVARVLVLNQFRKALGGHLKWIVVGASALRPEISRLFSAGKIRIIEGYGMTEMAPLISINRLEPGLYRSGSVGMSIPGVEIKIDDPDENETGEILVKGPNLMVGYYQNKELTQASITADGWLKTGDIGRMGEKRFLYITDRKKDIFKTSSGKYISPLPLQLHFEQSPFILRCLILGFQKPFVTALIVPNFELLETWCKMNAVHYTSAEYMVHNIKVRELYKAETDKLNTTLANHEQVRDFVLCHQDWTIENKEVTTTLKPIRHLLMEHYHKAIDAMYDN